MTIKTVLTEKVGKFLPFHTMPVPRHLKAFALLAGIPLAAIAYLGTELALTMAPTGKPAGSVVLTADLAPKAQQPQNDQALEEYANDLDTGENKPGEGLQAEKAETPDEAAAPAAQFAWQLRRNDPIADYVAQLGVPASTVSYTVESGDTLLGVLYKLSVAAADANAVGLAIKDSKLERQARIKPDQILELELGGVPSAEDPRPLISASVKLNAMERLVIRRDGAGAYTPEIEKSRLVSRNELATGVITSSLFASAAAEGISNAVVARFAQIYSFEVDFQRDIHPNDAFEIYYRDYVTEDGESVPSKAEILYSRLSFGKDKVKSFYRFTTEDGKTDYYDENGKSARTFLMRTPIDGARISSGFGMRTHPISGYKKAHKGVDFAAPRGTHIYAAGTGTVEFAGRNGGYGNYIRIRHDSGYKTAYAHMNGFARGIKKGSRVSQGQVIGYVGSTGNSTGPHLHYEVLAQGQQVNPMSVKVPTGIKLAGAELDKFKSEIAEIQVALKAHPSRQLASSGGNGTTAANMRAE